LSDVVRGRRAPNALGLDAPRALLVRADEVRMARFAAAHESAVRTPLQTPAH
jgi:hypothetical protein